MANELKHTDVGGSLTEAEYDSITAHQFDSQAQGDMVVASSATQLSRLAVGTARQLLQTNAGGTDPEWTSNLDIPGTLDVTGAVTLDSSLTVAGTTTLNGTIVLGDAAADSLTLGGTIQGATPFVFEGATANDFETTFAVTDPTADRTITFPDSTLTVNAAADISGTTLASGVVTSSITTVGTIGTGVWQGTAIASGYIAADAITGAKIADDAIDSEHYTDGSIDTAHIADNAITLAKLAGGTDGNIISFDANGDPVAIATGNDGQVLTSTGAGSPPAFEDAAGGGVSQATQAAIEAETNEDTYIPPDLIKHSPGVAKVWVKWEQSGAHGITASYNMTSVTDGGAAGDTDHLWDVDFSGTDYVLAGMPEATAVISQNGVPAAGGISTLTFVTTTGAGFDSTVNKIVVFGDQ